MSRTDWHVLKLLNQGGQGRVELVRQLARTDDEAAAIDRLTNAVRLFSMDVKHLAPQALVTYSLDGQQRNVSLQSVAEDLSKPLWDVIVAASDPTQQRQFGALKTLLPPSKAREKDSTVARERMRREIEVFKTISHPNLVSLLDADERGTWYVTPYFRNKTLAERKEIFRGNIVLSLKTLRPVVAAVAAMHESKFIHRDIKPENIFISDLNEPILGDLGLVYYEYDEQRLSRTGENVGSWCWMPDWAEQLKLDPPRPSFDVFSLAKVLWWMISGLKVTELTRWYIDSPRHPHIDIEKLFPNSRHMDLVKELLSKCITEHENDAKTTTAAALLMEIDLLLQIIERGGDKIDAPAISILNNTRPCKTCGLGRMQLLTDKEVLSAIGLIGNDHGATRGIRYEQCDKCGHIDLFAKQQARPVRSIPSINEIHIG